MKPSSVRLPQNFSPTGYEPLEILHQGRHSLVYRALRSEDQTSVIIKTTLPQVVLQSSHYLAFRNQFTISQNLDHPGIIQILGLEPCHQSYALVMEDVQGIPLSEFLQSSVPLQEGLTIALQLTEVLYYLAQQRVLHKDIKPANILIHPQTLQIKLIDFGIASLLPKETQEIKNPNALEGTLAYMAPEQTGRMNRGIDFRSDFYGLGVTLFELFAGQLPFQADEPMEWLHCHIAQKPSSLTEFGVPITIANIVSKLLAKNAEDRYQSALGLKHDLEQCLIQLRERGEIEPFELGQEDRCDRILIPEKLYGREAEVKALLDTFDRVAQGSSELMLVAGFSGIGKTAVINEVHKPITQKNGYFIKGKFDQFNRNIPFSAFVQAFRSLMEQLLGESDETLADWQAKILAAVGENGQVLIEVIPELERIIGKQQVVNALSGSAAQNRFNLIFSKFIRVFTTYDHPLVIFLDDLQWVDSASLNLLQLLMDDDSGFLLVVGAYRDNEVLPEHPLIMTLANVKERATVNTLTLNALRENDIRNLVADSLHCSVELTLPFAQLVYQKTKGNPFFATQFIQGLAEEGWITYSVKTGYWQCDLTQVHQLALTDDVVMFMVKQIQKLPNATQATLKIAACIGNRFDLATISAILEERQEDVSTNLLHALQVGLVIPDNQTYKFFQGSKDEIRKLDDITVEYRFLHDRVQQAAYALIPENEKHITHAKIGKFLLKKSSADQHGDSFFEIVNHLNKCIEFDSSQAKRLELLQLNCIAGKRAKASAAYVTSVSYLDIAKQLLPVDSWQQMYKESLDIYFNLAESQYLSGNFQESLGLVETIVSVSKQPLEQAEALNLAVLQCTLQGKFLEAIHYGQRALKYLNFELPTTNLAEQLKSYQAEINTKLAAYKIEELVNIPENNNIEQHVIIKVLSNLFVPTYVLQNEDLYFFITLSIILINLDFGMVVGTSYGFAFYGMFLGGRLGDYKLGYEFGLLAQQIAKRFNQDGNLCKVLYTLGNNLLPWVQPLRNSEPIFREGLAVGLESGELVFSGNILMYQPLNPFYAGDNISDIHKDLPKYLKFADRTLKYQLAIDVMSGLNIWLSHILESPNKDIPTEAEFIAQCESNNSTYAICHYWILKTKILCLYGQYEEALASAQNAETIISVIAGKYQVGALNFYQSIAIIEHQRLNSHINNSLMPNGDYLQNIEANQTQLRKWAEACPENFAHKYHLIEASLNSLLGNQLQAIEKFDLAISGAKENGYLQEEALANELAAKFYLDWGKDKVASTYMQEAYHCYARWGAKAKTNDLERRYPELLSPIFQAASPSINPLDTLASLVAPNLSIHSSASVHSTQTTFNTAFDFSAILQGAQVLSDSLHIDELLEKLAPMMLQDSGADRLVLLLPNADTWQIRATATPDTTQLCTVPLTDHPDLPLQLIQYVKNTQETLVIDNLKTDLPILDRYLETHQPQSVLCLPILYQGGLRGLLYLQNQLTSGVFTRDRITVLNFLCSQAAISLENARLFSERLDIESELHQLNTQLDQRVQERTQELTQTLDTLQSTQASLVEAEKMAALGTLVAGVAHEINTPIGTSITVASTLADESELFVQAVETGQLKRSTLNHYLGVVRQCTQLINSNLSRAGDLIQSFKQIAVDQSHRELRTFNLKDYVEEVVTSLQPQVKRSGHHLSVTGTESITLTNDPGIIAQIITNLVTNSIKHAYPDGGTGQLKIQIKQQEHQAVLTYRDNGCGISSEHLSKVYDPFFTTARHQGGTGLGLNIVYNIVTQSLKGTIQMDSQVGQGTTFVISIPLEQG